MVEMLLHVTLNFTQNQNFSLFSAGEESRKIFDFGVQNVIRYSASDVLHTCWGAKIQPGEAALYS